MNNTVRILAAAAAVIFLYTASLVSADDTLTAPAAPASGPAEPDETEIILPQMYLEIEDLTIEEIDAVIPDDTEVMLSSLELPLPEPDDIEIPAGVFALSDESAPVSPAQAAGTGGGRSSFFSEGTIGIGTSARMTGDINLYHVGSQPDFRLRYFHDSSDGYAGSEAGQGFSSREELIEAEVNYSAEKLSADLLVEYNETEVGLQGAGDYYSATRRIPSLASGAEWKITDTFKLEGGVDASMSSLQLNARSPLSYGLFSVMPEAGIVFGTGSLNAGISLNYGLTGLTSGADLVQDLGGMFSFAFEPADIFRISGEAGILWNGFSSLYYPFVLEVSGTAAAFDYSIGGGYRTVYTDRDALLDIFPAAAGPLNESDFVNLPLTHGWFAEGGFRWNISDFLSVNATVGFSALENTPKPAVSAFTGFNTVEAAGSTCLDTGAGLYLRLTDNFTAAAGWEGQLLSELDWFRPKHSFNGELEYTSDSRNLGISGSAVFNVYDQSQSWYTNDWMPELGLEGYFRIADGFVISLEGKDLSAGLLDGGRKVWDGYSDTGAMLQAKIKISL